MYSSCLSSEDAIGFRPIAMQYHYETNENFKTCSDKLIHITQVHIYVCMVMANSNDKPKFERLVHSFRSGLAWLDQSLHVPMFRLTPWMPCINLVYFAVSLSRWVYGLTVKCYNPTHPQK